MKLPIGVWLGKWTLTNIQVTAPFHGWEWKPVIFRTVYTKRPKRPNYAIAVFLWNFLCITFKRQVH